MNTRRFQFRTTDLLLVVFLVALTMAAVMAGPIDGPVHAPILLLVLAGVLGAATGRLVSDAYRVSLVGGLLSGVLGYLLAVVTVSLGTRIADQILFLVFVSAGGILGGLLPATLRRWRQASWRVHLSMLLVVFGLLGTVSYRCWKVSRQNRVVEELQAAGALIEYSEFNPFPKLFDSIRLQSSSRWLRKMLGLTVESGIVLKKNADHRRAVLLLGEHLPRVKDLTLHADHMDDDTFVLLNSGRLSQLESLRIRGRFRDREFGDAAFARLDPLPGLVVLDLRGMSVTDVSVEHILNFPRLTLVDVRETDVTTAGVERLKSKIGRVLSSNKISVPNGNSATARRRHRRPARRGEPRR